MAILKDDRKNYLINGGFDIWQRSTGPVVISTSGGGEHATADRWKFRQQGTWNANVTSERSTDVPSDDLSYSNLFVGNPADSLAIINNLYIIENLNSQELAGKTISLSISVKSESARDVRLVVDVPDTTNSYTTTTVASDTTQSNVLTIGQWTTVTFENISIPSTAVRGLRIAALLTNMSVTGSSVNHYIGKAILNEGPTAASFKRSGRNIGEETSLCQRYFWTPIDLTDTSIQHVAHGRNTGSTTANLSSEFPVRMRAVPSLIVSGTISDFKAHSGTGSADLAIDSLTVSNMTKDRANFNITTAGTFNAGGAATLRRTGSTAFVAWDAEI